MGVVKLVFLDEGPASGPEKEGPAAAPLTPPSPGTTGATALGRFAPPPPALGHAGHALPHPHHPQHPAPNSYPPAPAAALLGPPHHHAQLLAGEGEAPIDPPGRIYCCRHCKAHLSTSALVLSKSYQASSGAAYLFERLFNIRLGEQQGRVMNTGYHVVEDVFCIQCSQILGWRYVHAQQPSQTFKEGKYIMELAFLDTYPYPAVGEVAVPIPRESGR